MGCFNMMGFYSKLPITDEDKAVLIICGQYKYHKKTTITPCYVDDIIQPLFLPIIGTYDEYGSIEDYDTSENSVAHVIQQVTKTNINDLINAIHRNGLKTLEDIEEEKKSVKTIESLYRLAETYETALKEITNQTILGLYKKDLTLTYVIERLDVYNKMTEMTINNVKEELIEELKFRADNNIKGFVTDDYSLKNGIRDILKNIYDTKKNLRILIDKTEEKTEEMSLKGLNHRFSNGTTLCEGYKNIVMKENSFNDIVNFISFHKCLTQLCGSYMPSQYGNQGIQEQLDNFNELYQFYTNIINEKIIKYKEELEDL